MPNILGGPKQWRNWTERGYHQMPIVMNTTEKKTKVMKIKLTSLC